MIHAMRLYQDRKKIPITLKFNRSLHIQHNLLIKSLFTWTLFYHTIYLTSKTYYSFKSVSLQSTTFIFNLNSKFCSQSLKNDEKQFTNTVAKLNVNIIYLCLFKHVPLTNVLLKHTLENIFYFVDHFVKMESRLREK